MALPAASQWKDWDYDLDQEKKPWKELQAQLPPYPKPENLLRFDTGATASNSYFVDSTSISVGDDGVVRYTLLIRTGGGATNVSFEGIRCDPRELKVYAFGRPNSEWSRARDTSWRRIEFREINNHHLTLHREYFCPARKWAAPLKQIVQTLKYGPPRQVAD
ncbi:MAG: CNP1-like family protein [Burkholderiales bacterium]